MQDLGDLAKDMIVVVICVVVVVGGGVGGWIDCGWGNSIWIEWGGIVKVAIDHMLDYGQETVEFCRYRIILGVAVELGCVGNVVGGMGDEMIIIVE